VRPPRSTVNWLPQLVVVALLVAAASPAQAQRSEFPRTTLGRAASCYYALDYDCVVELLSSLPTDYPAAGGDEIPGGLRPLDLPLLLEAGRILAVAQLALGKEGQAREVFVWLLAIDPQFLVTGTEVPPRFLAVFYEVRGAALAPPIAARFAVQARALSVARGRWLHARATAVRVAKLPPIPGTLPRLPEPLIVSVTGGARFVSLTGDDAEAYGGALGFVGGGRLVFDERWVVGAEVGVSVHPVELENLLDPGKDELRLLTVAVVGGTHLRLFQGLALQPGLRAGLATYGVSAWAQRTGLASGAQVDVVMSWLAPLQITADAGALAVTPLQGALRTSTLLHAGLRIGATF
jgi:hypothetical protein